MITGRVGDSGAAVAGKRYVLERRATWHEWQRDWIAAWSTYAFVTLWGLLDFLFEQDIDNESAQGLMGLITPHADEMVARVTFLLELIRDLGVAVSDCTEGGQLQKQLRAKARAVLAEHVFRPESVAEPYRDKLLADEGCLELILEYFAAELDEFGQFGIPGITCLVGDAQTWAYSFAEDMAWSGFLSRSDHQDDYVDVIAGLSRLELVVHRDNFRSLTEAGWDRLLALALWPRHPGDIPPGGIEAAVQEAVAADSPVTLLFVKALAKQRLADRTTQR